MRLARTGIVLASFLGVLATSGAVLAQPAPPGAYVPDPMSHVGDPDEDWREVEVEHTSLDKALVIPGAVFLGAGWAVNWLTALIHSVEGSPAEAYLPASFVPIAGPIVDAALQYDSVPLATGLHIAWALVQVAGLTIAIVGTVRPRVRTEIEWQRVAVLPWGGSDGAGLTAHVAF